jgi:hypothetical protein
MRKALMKKVRYKLGALGALGAVPALGLAAPVAHAATTQLPRETAKTVVLSRGDTPAANCRALYNNHQNSNHLTGHVYYGNNQCLFLQSAVYGMSGISSLWERVRFYGASGQQVIPQRFVTYGSQSGGKTTFESTPDVGGVYKVCQAIVPKSNTTKVLGGPVCESLNQ